ncbi:sulfotransferase 1C2-like [Brevipalpus obovatus]|uniref:sulfotransferase 1C2-like n=1 Tax=Brevipalpus obovatus TaxID=246614 RepID=UPI003D9EC645
MNSLDQSSEILDFDRKNDLKSGGKKIPLLKVDGLKVPYYFDEVKVREALNFQPGSNDVFVVTYPKCGTVWMTYILWSIKNGGRATLPDLAQLNAEIPYIERTGTSNFDKLTAPRMFSSHLPAELMPYHPEARYIYVARNPRDVAVSYYHMTKEVLGGPDYREATFDEYFGSFISAEVPYGDYMDHLRNWCDRISEDNILFLTYEWMRSDPKAAILSVANFVSDEQHDYVQDLLANGGEKLEKVIENTSFNSLKKLPVIIKKATEKKCIDPSLDQGVKLNFFRRGIIGDWMNHFNESQINLLNQKMNRKLNGSSALSLWKF